MRLMSPLSPLRRALTLLLVVTLTATATFAGFVGVSAPAAQAITPGYEITSSYDGFNANTTYTAITASVPSGSQGNMAGPASAYSTTGIVGTGNSINLLIFENDAPTLTFTFNPPVDNPILHIERIGGNSGPTTGAKVSNSSQWTLATAGTSLTRLSGVDHFEVVGNTIFRTPNETMQVNTTGACDTDRTFGTACGSVMVVGEDISTLTFTSVMVGAGVGEGTNAGDGVDMRIEVPIAPAQVTLEKVVVNDEVVPGTATTASFTLTADDGLGTSISGVSGDAAVTSAELSQGTYTLSESTVDGYTQTSLTCAGGGSLSGTQLTVSPAEVVTCTFTNDDVDADGDGYADDPAVDTDPTNACVPFPYATAGDQPANGTDADCDGDGALNADDTDPADACVSPTDTGWTGSTLSDCDGDGITVADGDTDDTDVCVPVPYATAGDKPAGSTATDCDGDGVDDASDPDNGNACVPSPYASTGEQPAGGTDGDCDGDGALNADDTDAGDPCAAPGDLGWTELATNDCDGDGLTVGGGDTADTDPCVTFPYATAGDKPAGSTPTDCDGDAVADSVDPDNGNPCVPTVYASTGEQPAGGTDADCDGDGALNDDDTDAGDPCAAPGDLGWTELATNDCDGDGITVGGGDVADTDPCVISPYATAGDKPAGSTASDCDADGVADTVDADNGDPCVPNPYASAGERPAGASDADCDGDGSLNADDTDPGDPCSAPTDTGYVAPASNDCDGDGITVGAGDTADTDPCVIDPYASALDKPAGSTASDCDADGTADAVDPDNGNPCVPSPYATAVEQPAIGSDADCDGDGALNDDDTDPGDPCSAPADTGWIELGSNDCDGDGITVLAGDTADTNPCVIDPYLNAADQPAGGTDSDCDGDGVANVVDAAPGNPCVPSPYATLAELPAGYSDDDCDGDGALNVDDTDPADPCSAPTDTGYVAPASNDCDGDGITVGAGDTDDTDICVPDATGPTCDFDGDGVPNASDTDPADPCVTPSATAWVAQNSNDCDGDGVTVGAGDLDDFDVCADATDNPIASCLDSDGDGVTDDVDADAADPCVPDNSGPDCDIDGDGVTNAADVDPGDPCVSPAATGWTTQATNDCDGDGVTSGAGDLDDFDVCVDASGTIPSCSDTDGDGVTDDVDTDPADPCVSVNDTGWTAQNSNDCDGDGTTVGEGDSDDYDPCVDTGTPAPGTNDCDMDGVTVADGDLDDTDGCIDATGTIAPCLDSDGDGITDDVDPAINDACDPDNTGALCDADGDGVPNGVDLDPADPCVSPTASGWTSQPTNDCDGDGVTAATDVDDFDVCQDAAGTLASCLDSDGDGVTDDVDTDPADPCVSVNDTGWTAQNSNDCDGDGTTVGEGDSDDYDPCVDTGTPGPATNDCDMDGVTVGDGDLDDTDGCVDAAGTIASCLDSDGDGITDDVDPGVNDACDPDNTGALCDADGDGVANGVDSDPADPCVSPTASGWVALASNDCDGDGVTVGAGDLDDFDVCADATDDPIASCLDSDGDGVTDDIDLDPADSCIDRSQVGWTALASNDCDLDGVTVGEGDLDDYDACADDSTLSIPSCTDTDGDGVTDDVDVAPADPCQDPAATGWTSQPTNDCDGDGISLADDTDDTDPCVPDATGPDCDFDGDGVINSVDADATDPCVSPNAIGWTTQATNDCDGDGVTSGAGDLDDFDVCVDASGTIPSCSDSDGDGVTDDVDTDPADPCQSVNDAGWTAQNSNDCDGDGTTVGEGDSDDFDSCVDTGTPAPGTNDCDMDGVTVGDGDLDDTDGCIDAVGTIPSCSDTDGDGISDDLDTDPANPCDPDNTGPSCDADGDGVVNAVDLDPADPCVSPTAAGWVALASNDCDGDGVTVADGDIDDFDVCADATDDPIASCVDSDGDGISDDVDPAVNDACDPDNTGPLCDADGDGVANGVDADAADPCVSPTATGWVALASNDCDGDGVTVADGDLDDFDGCVDAVGDIAPCLDSDGDGYTDDVDPAINDACVPDNTGPLCDIDGDGVNNAADTDPADPCVSPTATGWVALPSNDCDADGVTVADGDIDDFDVCADATDDPIASCVDSDGDGITDDVDPAVNDACDPDNTGPSCDLDGDGVSNAADSDPGDPCVSPTATGWVALPANDCDGDGVTVADGDLDDFDVCQDAAGTLASCLDTDGDGISDDVDTDPADPCDPDNTGPLCDADADGVLNGVDSDPADPCVSPTATGWVALPANDCDGDGVTVADGDIDDFDVCADATDDPIASCVDSDGDGVTDDVDADPANECVPDNTGPSCDIDGDGVINIVDTNPSDPCVSPTETGWVALSSNDCDGDGVTVGDGDLDDFDVCADASDDPIASCSDTDGDGITDDVDTDPANPCDPDNTGPLCDADGDGVANAVDLDPANPCVSPDALGWVALASNDCDDDGVTVGDGDLDDFDGCMDAAGMIAPCLDSDGDGITDDVDTDAADPCVPDNSGPLCDIDGDGVANGVDTDPADPCTSPSALGWTALASNDCDGDGVTVADGDLDDFDVCQDAAGTLASCLDTDGDGISDDVDTDPADPCDPDNTGPLCDADGDGVANAVDLDPANPCVSPDATGWVALPANDCDGDGVTVADGDLDDFDGCFDAVGEIAPCLDTDGDGVTDDVDTDPADPCDPDNSGPLCDADGDGVANGVDSDAADPCVSPTASTWVALDTNDCDGDGVTVGDGDIDDFDACQDAAGTLASCLDSDGDGFTDDVDPAIDDACDPDNTGPLCDIDGDGVNNAADTDPGDPCVSPTATGWVALDSNDCDGDGVTVGDGDIDDFDACQDAAGTLASCLDTDGDGITDDVDDDIDDPCVPDNSGPLCDVDGDGVANAVDTDPADPCVSPTASTWVALDSNDCDGDGVTVGDGDIDDFDECKDDSGLISSCLDSDGDGVTDDIDADPEDACESRSQVGWTAQASNDCDGDGVTLGEGDQDDRDPCVDDDGTLASCLDSDGDGVTDDVDAEPNDPCLDPNADGWTARLSNDCDGDGVTVADGDIDDFDECADADVADLCTDTDGDGVADFDDSDPIDPCVDRAKAGWTAQITNDCDGDGVTVADGDQNDFDVCVDANGTAPSCMDSDGDGIPDDVDTDPNNSCNDPSISGWVAALSNDCDEDGVTVGDGDLDDRDPCIDAAGDACFMIDGRVWFDVDRGADQDTEEVDFSGVRLLLIDATTGAVLDEAFTASPYSFTDVPRGTYRVEVDASTLPIGLGETYEEDGSKNQSISVAIIDSDQLSKDFGYATAQICGQLTHGASKAANASVIVTDANGNVFETTSDAEGNYCVEGTLDKPLMAGAATVAATVGGETLSETVTVVAGASQKKDFTRTTPAPEPYVESGWDELPDGWVTNNTGGGSNTSGAEQPTGPQASVETSRTGGTGGGGSLAFTGSNSTTLAVVGGTLVLSGAALVALSKRRRREDSIEDSLEWEQLD